MHGLSVLAIRTRWRAALGLGLIVALAAGLRFWGLAAVPPGFHYDEAYEAWEAWRVITQPGYRPIFFAGNFGVEPMFIYLTSLAFRLFGETPAVMRGVAALIGTLTVPALFGLGRELALNDRRFPPAAGWLAALALAIMRWHITFSRVGIEPILVPFFLVLLLWAFWRAWRTGSLLAWAATGALAGAGVYIYPAARLLPVLLGFLTLLALIVPRGKRDDETRTGISWPSREVWRGLIVAWLAAGLVALPMAWNWFQHPDQLLLRSSQIAVGPGDAARGTPLQNLVATLGMFSVRGDRDPRSNVPGMPAFDPLISVPFMIGVGLALWRWKRPVCASLMLALLLMLVPTVLSEHAPHFRRTVAATPLAALLIGLGAAAMLGRRTDAAPATAYVPRPLAAGGWEPAALAGQMDRLRWWGRVVAVAAILSGSAIHSASAYFDVWGRSNALFYAYDEGLWEIGRYVLELKDDTQLFLSPRPATDMTLAFAWRNGPAVRRFDGRHAFIAPSGDRPATYLIIDHEDFRGAMLLRDLYPGARLAHTFHDRHGRRYARVFRVEQPGAPARRPQTPLDGRWPGIRLIGYDVDKRTFAPGEKIFLQLWWRAEAAALADWTVFTHVLGPPKADGSIVWAGLDAPPGQGSARTHTWAAGDLILDEYQIALPADMPAGEYRIEVGFYLPQEGGRRLAMLGPAGQDYFIVGAVQVR